MNDMAPNKNKKPKPMRTINKKTFRYINSYKDKKSAQHKKNNLKQLGAKSVRVLKGSGTYKYNVYAQRR